MLQRLAVLRIAQQAGFTIAELRTLLQGFGDTACPSERWHRLAERKLSDLDALVTRAESMKRLLRLGLACGCVRWEECRLLHGVDGSQVAHSAQVMDRSPRRSAARSRARQAGLKQRAQRSRPD